jgi:hypothetical protein
MPRKHAPAKTGRPPAIPYDLRKSHIPRIPRPGEDPTGGYIPAVAKKQIETMQERQASFGLPLRCIHRFRHGGIVVSQSDHIYLGTFS